MGKIWLGSLPQVLGGAGLEVDTYPGWETRSRSTGGYEQLLGIQVHHTGSATSPANDMGWMWDNAPAKPIGAVLLDRSGKWTVGAAGATNTSGRGGPMVTSRGTIPKDQGNMYLLSIEAANNGHNEPWPDEQLWSYVVGCAALARAYGFNPQVRGDLHGHFEYTSRKIDPAGPSWYSPDARSWAMTQFRDNVATYQPPPPAPPPAPPVPPTLEELMEPTCYVTDTKLKGTFALVAGRWVPWLFPDEIPREALHYSGSHPFVREQILADQGATAAELWRERGAS